MSTSYYSEAGPLWAITCYYNPNRYWRRRANYAQFRRHLDLPLLAVELNLGGEFELDESDAEILIRRQAGDVMWQKERLLNIALASLPASCEFVVWLDCDVLFPRPSWADDARMLLERHVLVQPFSRMLHLRPDADLQARDWEGQALFCKPSIGSIVLEGLSPAWYFAELAAERQKVRGTGHAWMARRETIETCGFYDFRIIGGGDAVLTSAAFGQWDYSIHRQKMNERQTSHYWDWAHRFHGAVQGRVGCLDQAALHLWHGEIANRRYRERFGDWQPFDFDPTSDIRCEPGGAWRWASDKPGLHAHLRNYFVARNEDGAELLLKAA